MFLLRTSVLTKHLKARGSVPKLLRADGFHRTASDILTGPAFQDSGRGSEEPDHAL